MKGYAQDKVEPVLDGKYFGSRNDVVFCVVKKVTPEWIRVHCPSQHQISITPGQKGFVLQNKRVVAILKVRQVYESKTNAIRLKIGDRNLRFNYMQNQKIAIFFQKIDPSIRAVSLLASANPLLNLEYQSGKRFLFSQRLLAGVNKDLRVNSSTHSLTVFIPTLEELESINWIGFSQQTTQFDSGSFDYGISSGPDTGGAFAGTTKEKSSTNGIHFRPLLEKQTEMRLGLDYWKTDSLTGAIQLTDTSTSQEFGLKATSEWTVLGVHFGLKPDPNLKLDLKLTLSGKGNYQLVDSSGSKIEGKLEPVFSSLSGEYHLALSDLFSFYLSLKRTGGRVRIKTEDQSYDVPQSSTQIGLGLQWKGF